MATSEKTLARLSFWVPPERMAEFATDYEAKVVSILKAHGLVESAERGRVTVEGVFSRLFEFATPSEVLEQREMLQGDPAFQKVLQDLGMTFGIVGPDVLMKHSFTASGIAELDVLMKHSFNVYSTPAEFGKVVSAGPGKQVPAGRGKGRWRTYDVADGIPSTMIYAIFQDREGNLWFGTLYGGVSWYDGRTFTTFTTREGLAHNTVSSIFQDRDGNLWFGTGGVDAVDGGGVSRYDPSTPGSALRSGQAPSTGSGQRFTTFTHEDGLSNSSNRVGSCLQDRDGNFWFGTFGGGVCRYDGQTFAAFTVHEGLMDPLSRALSIFQDRDGNLWFGTYRGVTRYDRKTLTNFGPEDGLAGWVMSILQDREGNLWFATLYGGVSRYDGRAFKTFRVRPRISCRFAEPHQARIEGPGSQTGK